MARWFRWSLSVADPFVCRCQSDTCLQGAQDNKTESAPFCLVRHDYLSLTGVLERPFLWKVMRMETACQCAAASGVRDGSRPPATGLQEQVANRHERLWLRAKVVSIMEKVL